MMTTQVAEGYSTTSNPVDLAADDEVTALKPDTLGLYIVSEIYKHGALSLMELQEEVEKIVGYLPSEGALYGTASRLKSDGLIVTEKSEVTVKKHKIKVRVYKATDKGKMALNKTLNSRQKELAYLNKIFTDSASEVGCGI